MQTRTSDRLAQLKGYANALSLQVQIMDERRHILQPLVRDDEIKTALHAKFNETLGASAFNHLVPLLAFDLVRDLARLILDEDPKAGSLWNIHRKASEPKLHRVLREQFRTLSDPSHESASYPGLEDLSNEQRERARVGWRDNDRAENEADFDRTWTSVSEAVARLALDDVAKKIGTLRDRYIAHFQMAKLGEEPKPFRVSELGLSFDDVFAFADRYLGPVVEITRLITLASRDVEDSSRIHRRYGETMWRMFAGLPPIAPSAEPFDPK
jgi:hypothetical protein